MKPRRAMSIASDRHASRPNRACVSASAAQPRTAPGTVTEFGPVKLTGSSGDADAGAGPAASRPRNSPSRHTKANTSPPMPVCIGSVIVRTAAEARAASAAFPPRASIRTPARVASGWLVATIARSDLTGARSAARYPVTALRGD